MSGNHSPGPWVHYHGPRDTMVSINTLDGKEVGGVWCETWNTKERGINENVLANARLIAAAPDLIKALRLFEQRIAENGEWDDGCFYYGGTSASELQEPLTLARASIAKAEGRS